MQKKEYIKPQATVICIQTACMLAGSGTDGTIRKGSPSEDDDWEPNGDGKYYIE